MAKVIISCAITGGIHTPSMSPYLPITPEEIAAFVNDVSPDAFEKVVTRLLDSPHRINDVVVHIEPAAPVPPRDTRAS